MVIPIEAWKSKNWPDIPVIVLTELLEEMKIMLAAGEEGFKRMVVDKVGSHVEPTRRTCLLEIGIGQLTEHLEGRTD